jgi:hypothetical protein
MFWLVCSLGITIMMMCYFGGTSVLLFLLKLKGQPKTTLPLSENQAVDDLELWKLMGILKLFKVSVIAWCSSFVGYSYFIVFFRVMELTTSWEILLLLGSPVLTVCVIGIIAIIKLDRQFKRMFKEKLLTSPYFYLMQGMSIASLFLQIRICLPLSPDLFALIICSFIVIVNVVGVSSVYFWRTYYPIQEGK